MEQTLELRVSLKELRRQRREILIKLTMAFIKVNGVLKNGDKEPKKKEK